MMSLTELEQVAAVEAIRATTANPSSRHSVEVVDVVNAATSRGLMVFDKDQGDFWVSSADASLAVYRYVTLWTCMDKYNPDMVTAVLEADTRPPAAKFTNLVDMLKWLDSD